MGYIDAFFSDPKGTLILLLLAFPGRMLAISAHEAAHGWMADRCGDPTARMMGRITLNPLKHLDPVGLIMMVLIGLGWAEPVPVNPRNYRNYRRDDLLVSLAGVTMNLILFVAGCLLMYAILTAALLAAPLDDPSAAAYRTAYLGQKVLIHGEYYVPLDALLRYGVLGGDVSEMLIAPLWGPIAGYLYEMLGYFVMTNLVLAIFNLIPLPPLDGYHALNDLALKRPLFASAQAQRVGNMLLFLGVISGVLTEALSWVYSGILTRIGDLAAMALRGLF